MPVGSLAHQKDCRRLSRQGIVLFGGAFYGMTLMMSGAFVVLVVYKGAAMAAAMAIYVMLAVHIRLPGAPAIAVAIALNILAAALQASAVRISVVWPFDHNGVFHLVQIAALIVLGHGRRAGMSSLKQISGRMNHPKRPN